MSGRFYDCITDFIFLEHELKKADVIFVPGGNYPESAQRAAALFADGYAPYVLPSGRYSKLAGHFTGDPSYETEWDYLRDVLQRGGVPDSAILKEDQATFTWENAICSRHVLEKLGIPVKTAIIVCQAFHARRCWMYYREQFPDTELLICPVVTRGITRENWYLDEDKIDTVLGEVERCGSQFHRIMKDKIRDPRPADGSLIKWWA